MSAERTVHVARPAPTPRRVADAVFPDADDVVARAPRAPPRVVRAEHDTPHARLARHAIAGIGCAFGARAELWRECGCAIVVTSRLRLVVHSRRTPRAPRTPHTARVVRVVLVACALAEMSNVIKNVPNLAGMRYRIVDASGEVLGRLASRVARALQGKDKPTYAPGAGSGDVIVVVNAADVALTGKKMTDKKYYRHTGYVGGLVERSARDMFERDPTWVFRKAVERMLPRNVHARETMRKLRVFPGREHTFDETKLVRMELEPRVLVKAPDARAPEGMMAFNPEAHARRVALVEKSEAARKALGHRPSA